MAVHARSRRRGSSDAAPAELRTAALDRWVEAGLISDEQARAITAFEATTRRQRPPSRLPPALEALAYLGGVLVAVGAAMLVSRFWDDLGTGGRLAVTAVAAAVTGVVGAVVGEADPVTRRLRGFLWALSSAGVAAVAGLFASEVLDLSGEPVALAAAGLGAVSSGAYWRLGERALQHLLTLAGLAVSMGVALAWADVGGLVVGLTLWALGAGWAWLAWRGLIPPAGVGFLAGVVLTLVAPAVVGGQVEWPALVLGLATATGWVAIGVVGDELVSLAPGLLGVFVYLPSTLGYYFGETVGAPVIAMLSGTLLLVVVVVLFRRRRGPRPGVADGGLRGGRFRRVNGGSAG